MSHGTYCTSGLALFGSRHGDLGFERCGAFSHPLTPSGYSKSGVPKRLSMHTSNKTIDFRFTSYIC